MTCDEPGCEIEKAHVHYPGIVVIHPEEDEDADSS